MHEFDFSDSQTPRRPKTAENNNGYVWLFFALLVAGCVPAFTEGYLQVVFTLFAVEIAVCGWLLAFHRSAASVLLSAVAVLCSLVAAYQMQPRQHDTFQQTIKNFHQEQERLNTSRSRH